MKKYLMMVAMLFMSCGILMAQTSAETIKERKALNKYTKAQLKERSSRTARKQSKSFAKEGWEVTPGKLPLDKQFDRSYQMQYEFDDSGYPTYIIAEAMSTGENYDAAKMQALELSKQNLAGQVQTEITAIIENTVANKQLTAEQAASVAQSVEASKNIVSQSLGRVLPVVECYRTKSNKNKEVYVSIAYNSKMAMEQAKQAIRKDLEEKGNKLHEQLDAILGF